MPTLPSSSPTSPSTSSSRDYIATLASRFRPSFRLLATVLGAALLVFLAFTCSSSDEEANAVCPPTSDTAGGRLLAQAQSQASFDVLYPCTLPNAQYLTGQSVTGNPGRQQVELIFEGPFDLTIRQAQFPPPVSPDPTGASRSDIDLFSNVRAILIERNDGSSDALYHLYWQRGPIYYEVQAIGPPLQRRTVLLIATSLQ